MPQGRPMPGELYRHFKNKKYQIIAVATHSETREPYVVYQALYGDFLTYIRPYEMFVSDVDRVKYPDVQQKYRFEYIGNHCVTEAQQTQTVNQNVNDASDVMKPMEHTTASCTADESAEGIDPRFLAFLDAELFEDKYKIVTEMEEELDNHLINQMAASIDVIIEDGDLAERVMELKKCIRMRAHFEAGRNR